MPALRLNLLAPAAAAVWALALGAQTPGTPSAQAIIEANCTGCHGAAKMSGLDLRERDGMLRGGKRGPAVLPGNPSESLLYRAVLRSGELQMPPGKIGLPPGHVQFPRTGCRVG